MIILDEKHFLKNCFDFCPKMRIMDNVTYSNNSNCIKRSLTVAADILTRYTVVAVFFKTIYYTGYDIKTFAYGAVRRTTKRVCGLGMDGQLPRQRHGCCMYRESSRNRRNTIKFRDRSVLALTTVDNLVSIIY